MIKYPQDYLQDLYEICKIIKSKPERIHRYMKEPLREIRLKSIDKLISVSKHLKIQDSTYFVAVEYFDTLLEIADLNIDTLDEEEIFIISFVCLYQATKKYENINIERSLDSIPMFKYIIKSDLFKQIQNLMALCIGNKIQQNYFEEFSYFVLNYFDDNDKADESSLSDPYENLFIASKFLFKMALQNYNFYRKLDETELYLAILMFTLNNDFKIKELEINFKNFPKFCILVESCNMKMKNVAECCINLKKEYLSYLKQNYENDNYLFEIEYLSIIEIKN
jgi:hypothetical protein